MQFTRSLAALAALLVAASAGGCAWGHKKPQSYDRMITDEDQDPTYRDDPQHAGETVRYLNSSSPRSPARNPAPGYPPGAMIEPPPASAAETPAAVETLQPANDAAAAAAAAAAASPSPQQ